MPAVRDTGKGYRMVPPTAAEVQAWNQAKSRGGHRSPRTNAETNRRPPYRIACDRCGHRLWLSGLGWGAHLRSKRHQSAA